MIRVSLEIHFTGTKGLFMCVADHKMLGHQIRSNIIEHQLKQKTNQFDRRFLKVFQPMKRDIISNLIFNEILIAKQIKSESRVLVWESTVLVFSLLK